MARKMTIEDKQRVIELEKRERYSITQIFNKLKSLNKYNYTLYLSTIDSDCPYDGILTIYDKSNNSILETIMIEQKNRSNNYSNDGFIFERKKYTALLKAKETTEYELQRPITLMYWNSTPEDGTFMWYIDDLDLKKSVRKEMNKETFAVDKTKVNKNVFLLQTKDAHNFKFNFNEIDYVNSLIKPEIKPERIIEKVSRVVSLF